MHSAARTTSLQETVRVRRDGPVAVISFNRAQQLNAIDQKTLTAFTEAVRECGGDDSVRAVVITGSGASFCAGIDLTALAQGQIPRWFFTEWEETMWLVETLPKPVIAAVHGHCIGAGLQLALACDHRVAERSSVFALPAAKEGLIPSLSPHRLWRFIGLARARQMVLFDERWNSAKALSNGLVDTVVDANLVDPPPLRDLIELSGSNERLAVHRSKAVMSCAMATAHDMAESLPTISFVKCKHLLSLPRHPIEDLFASYLAAQTECLEHPDHSAAAEHWLERSRRKAS